MRKKRSRRKEKRQRYKKIDSKIGEIKREIARNKKYTTYYISVKKVGIRSRKEDQKVDKPKDLLDIEEGKQV